MTPCPTADFILSSLPDRSMTSGGGSAIRGVEPAGGAVLAENVISITNVELAGVRLLPFTDRAQPYINSRQFPAHRLRGQAA